MVLFSDREADGLGKPALCLRCPRASDSAGRGLSAICFQKRGFPGYFLSLA